MGVFDGIREARLVAEVWLFFRWCSDLVNS